MDDQLNKIVARLGAELPGLVSDCAFAFGELTLTVDPARVTETLRFLRDDFAAEFVSIIDISAVDYPEREKRFDVVYHLLSPKLNRRIRVKVTTGQDTPIASATAVYPGATGTSAKFTICSACLFDGHPDLRRILTDYGFEGHPLRKDFPMTGFVEVRYDEGKSGCATSRCASTRNSVGSIS